MNKKCFIKSIPGQGWQIQDASHQTIKVPHPEGGYYKQFWDYESARAVALKNGYDPQN